MLTHEQKIGKITKLLKERTEVYITMTGIVETIKRTKARSEFIIGIILDMILYKFEGPDFIELVELGNKSTYAR